MSRYNDEEDKQSSIAFYKTQIIDKMADVMSDYIEMIEDHPEFKEEMTLCWGDLYHIRVYRNVPMEYSPIIVTNGKKG